jgi:hypothetical protein
MAMDLFAELIGVGHQRCSFMSFLLAHNESVEKVLLKVLPFPGSADF